MKTLLQCPETQRIHPILRLWYPMQCDLSRQMWPWMSTDVFLCLNPVVQSTWATRTLSLQSQTGTTRLMSSYILYMHTNLQRGILGKRQSPLGPCVWGKILPANPMTPGKYGGTFHWDTYYPYAGNNGTIVPPYTCWHWQPWIWLQSIHRTVTGQCWIQVVK